MVSVLLGLFAGALTTLSPCVLPVLPFVLLAALERHRWGPLALATGMAMTFAVLGTLVSGVGLALDISSDGVRYAGAALLALFGAMLLSSALQQRFAAVTGPLGAALGNAASRFTGEGIGGQFALGALLGAIWSPCSGPTLGAAVTLAASSETTAKASVIMLSFGLGASLPLLAIAYGSRATLARRKEALGRLARFGKPILGAVVLAAAVLVLTGFDKILEASLVRTMPDWLTTLTTRF